MPIGRILCACQITVNRAYTAWPTRLYLIDLDGAVVYAAGLGPYDFHPPKLGKMIEKYLAGT